MGLPKSRLNGCCKVAVGAIHAVGEGCHSDIPKSRLPIRQRWPAVETQASQLTRTVAVLR
jgi:hypothetical protein